MEKSEPELSVLEENVTDVAPSLTVSVREIVDKSDVLRKPCEFTHSCKATVFVPICKIVQISQSQNIGSPEISKDSSAQYTIVVMKIACTIS